MFDQLTPNVMVCVEGKIKEKVKKMKKRIVSGLEVTGGPGRRDRVRMHCVSRESRHKREGNIRLIYRKLEKKLA